VVSVRKKQLVCLQDACSQDAVNTNFVCYYRVSTTQQGISGLGLDAQQESVRNHIGAVQGTIVAEFTEVESGKVNERPILNQAIELCRVAGATLLVAKLDRLSRNLHFITTLQQSKVNFVAVDNPHATPFLIHILVAVAEYERTMISARTKAALDSAKRRGTKLGNPRFNESLGRARECRRVQSHQRFEQLVVVVCELQRSGCHRLKDLANGLNARGLKTARGCQFTPTQVHRILNFAQ
jgi:DNA invertase Pin-like site-specific DNA recombinase